MSTHLYRAQRLGRAHLADIAEHGFEVVEVVAEAGHFDARSPAAVADLQEWLAATGLTLHGVQAPAAGSPDDVDHALFVARRIPMHVLILPVGAPKSASKVVERIAPLAEPLGVTVAVDSRSPSMATIGSLVTFVERCEARVGIALDFATAAKGGDLVEAIEMASEHLTSARVPVDEGRIDWAAVLTTVQKVGYDGPLILDIDGRGPAKAMLKRASTARETMERWLRST